ncbi:dystonin isoform X5 [Kryptolebias marmoratus]|uniref:dystonin isoform X5 n=1 Tax=Kryptolebias marmoratus TaxID=37003 RepID=UPI0007F8FC8F|nr:dystonin isoform X5 [Kryptolebias marmoratus]
MMIAAAFLVLLRPYNIQCVLLLLLLLLGTIATILFFCCWHRRLRNGKHPIKSVLSGGRSRSRVGLRTHHFRSECFRHSPRHLRRSIHARVTEEKPNLVEVPESEPDLSSTLRKRKVKKRVLPEFYQSVQVTPTRKASSSSGNPSLHCSMSSSADISDEDDYSVKSGSASPAPGDTLPWNLPRHERSKRKIQGGSVLDPAERAVLRIADERDRVQKKTFTKWINQHLLKVRKHINDLYEDLRDGHNLISLLEVLSGDKLPRERGRMRFHRLQNVQIALDYLKRRQVKLVNIRNDDITDGNPKLTLGLIWTIILHFQISEIHVTGESEDMTAKERLLLWSKQITDGYVGVRCDNFTTSWRDGRLFNAIIHKYRPDLVDISRVSTQTNRSNLEQAFSVAEQLGVARLLDPEDVDVQSPDEKSVITYVSTLYDAFPKVPDGADGISPNDVDIKWVEYQNMIKYLSQWIKHNVAVMSDRSFPNNPVEIKALYKQYQQFKECEIPLKENEKTKIKNLYKMLEMWIEFGRIQLPPGHHPNDVEKEWGKLIVAMLEREKSLRPEVERLEMLQQIANRVQRDCVNGEDKLALARTALQSDTKRLESGIQFINEAETAGYLLECENILRQQVVDIQILLDGKFPFADQLVQRVTKLRDDLLALRAECSSVYSKGRTLTTEQTKMMISGITQSLNSGFSQNINASLTPGINPALTSGGLGAPGSTFTSGLTPCLTPSLTPALTPSLQPSLVQSYMGNGGGLEPGNLMQLKHMQIRKPLLKSSLADPSMTEEEVNMKYVQDLLNWVEEMQLQLDRSEWGTDLLSVEMHLDNHKSVHRAIEEFQMSLKDAKLSEIQMTIPLKLTYSDKLNKLERQYERLLSCSRERQTNLECLHDFVSQATQELIWLNEKEEEEVAFDWSDRNSNISRKRDYHADLMRELDEKEEAIKSVQDKAERLMLRNHPARLTIEAYKAAMQTQWSWILQLCSCVEQHLKENVVYFEFFSDAKESMDYLKNLQDSIQRKYSCDRSSSLHRLEDLIQESMDEKEQLLQYRSTVAGLVGRAKNIVQLKPRNPETPLRSSIPVKAICDYRQIEITIYKADECVLANNSHRAKWKVINPAGNEAMVPSVCFTAPPPNKEAVDMASRTEQLYQNVLALWHRSHINMKSVASWHYLMADIRAIRNWNVASIKTMLPGEHQQVLSNLQSHFDEFLEDSEESEVFTMADCTQLERDVAACKEYYQELLRSTEREEHEESVYNHYISEIRNFRMHLESHEEHLIRQIRTPLERDDLEQSLQRIAEHERKTAELEKLKDDLDVLKEKCEMFLRQAAGSPSVSTLSSELSVLLQSMNQVYSMSSIYMDKLKTVSLVVKHSQSAEALVKAYESKLYEEEATNSDVKSIESVISTLKQWRTEIDERQEVFHDMEDELQKARVISDRMFKAHNERDFDLDWHKEKADQLSERWQNIHSQIDSRLRDLDGISKSLGHYRDSYLSLDEWITELETVQLKAQENKPDDSKALAELLNKQKVLVAEIEQKQSRIDECQKYSEQYSFAIKEYELQLMTFRAMVDSQHKSPLKKRRIQSSSDAIQQEFMDLRTRYTALVTLMTQYVKFASETLKRTEEEERSVDEEKREHGDKVSKLLHWMSDVKQTMSNDGHALKDSNANTDASNKRQVSVEEMVSKKDQIAEALLATQMMLNKHGDKMTEEDREKTQKQLKALSQAYSELSQHCSDQTTSADEVSKITYGTGTGTMTGLPAQMTPNTLPDGLTSPGLSLSEPQVHLDWDESLKNIHMHTPTMNPFPENEEGKCIQGSHFSSVSLSDVAAVREESSGEDLVIKIIETNQVNDGVDVRYTGDVLTLEEAFWCGLIPASVYVKILQRKKSCQEVMQLSMAENVLHVEPEEGINHSEVNGLVLKCLSGDKSLASERKINTLRSACDGLNDDENRSRPLDSKVSDAKEDENVADVSEGVRDLRVDVAVQCDLMSSSSTLIVLGHQRQFMGLVLPLSGETMSSSFQQITTSEFTSKLFSNREKIAAFYIPESSEVIDITTAVKDGLIDSYTADILKSIEIPDVVPDNHLFSERFSTWLMYKKLAADRWRHPTDVSELNLPTPTEAEQLFISYLMINSYIDPRSAQRVLIFDSQLNETTQAFLKDPMFSQNITLNASDRSEQSDDEVLLQINEETEKVIKNIQADRSITLNENTIQAFEPHNFTFLSKTEVHFVKQTVINGNSSKQDPVRECFVSNYIHLNNIERDEVGESIFQNSKNWKELNESEEKICGNSVQFDTENAVRENYDVPACLEVLFTSMLSSIESKNTESSSLITANESMKKPIHQLLPHCNAESLCRESESADIYQAKFFCSVDEMASESECEHASQLLKVQVDESSFLNILFDLSANDLAEQHKVLEPDDLGSVEKTDVLSDVEFLSLNQANKCQADKQSFLRSDYNLSETLQFGSGEHLDSDSKFITYPKENCILDLSEDQTVALNNLCGAEHVQQQTVRQVAVSVLDLLNEEANKEIESARKHKNIETTSIHVDQSLPSESSHQFVMISPSCWSQVTADCDSHKDKEALLADSDSQVVINSQKTVGADVRSVIENAGPTKSSSCLSDRTSNSDSESQARNVTLAFNCHESNNQPTVFSDEFDSREETYAVTEGDLGTSLLLHNDLFEESRTESNTSDAHSASKSEPGNSSPGNVVEIAEILVSKGLDDFDIKCAEDGSGHASPQQAMPYSESIEFQSSCCQNIQNQSEPACDKSAQQPNSSLDLPTSFIDLKTANTVNHRSSDIKVPVLTSNDLSDFIISGENDVKLYEERLSQEKQHEVTFIVLTDTEHISSSKQDNDSNHGSEPCLNLPSVSSNIDLLQPETKMGEDLGSPSEPESVPVLPDSCVTEKQPTQQSNSSSDLPTFLNKINASNTDSHRSSDMEAPALTNNVLSDFTIRGKNDVKLHKERFSPERQHDDAFIGLSQTKQTASKQENDSSNEDLSGLNLHSVLSTTDLVQPETKMRDNLGSPSQSEKVPVLSEKNPAEQLNSSSDLPALSNDLNTANIVSHVSSDMEALALTNNDLSDSIISDVKDLNFYKERLSQEEQHDDAFIVPSDTEQISISKFKNDSKNGSVSCSNSQSVSTEMDMVQPEIKMRENLGSPSQSEKVPVLSEKNPAEQLNSSSDLPAFLNYSNTANTVNPSSSDMETPALTNNDLSDSIISCASNVKVYKGRLSPERQHDTLMVLSTTEQIALSEQGNGSNNEDVSHLNPPSVSSGIDLAQPETKMEDSLRSSSQLAEVPVLSNSCDRGKNPAQQSSSSSDLPALFSDLNTANPVSQMSKDVEKLAFANNDLSGSIISGSNNVKLCEEKLSPAMQHNTFIVPNDTEEVSLSQQENDSNSGSVSCLNPPSVPSDTDLLQSETKMGEDFGSHSQPVLSGSCVPSVVCSSSGPEICNGVKTLVVDQEEITTEHTNFSDLQKPQTQNSDCTNLQPVEDYSFHKSNEPHGLESTVTDTLRNTLKQNILISNNKNMESSELISQEQNVCENAEHVPNVQQELLPLLRTVSLNQDFSVLQEMVNSISSVQEEDSQEGQHHTLESIKEESSDGEDEKSTRKDKDNCHTDAKTNQSSAQMADNLDACKAEKLFSIHDYLECVGRLQDHADVLEDVKKDFLMQAPMGNSLEELQIQIEECQSFESELSKLGGVLTADMEKAKEILNSAHEDIPIQIHQDLASSFLALEPNFIAVFEMCAERKDSLIQAMEAEKVNLESAYQKHLSDLNELMDLIQHKSEMWDVDLNTCDEDTLKRLNQQSMDVEKNLDKEARLKLEDVTFDIQCFISEHAQFLSPTQSSYLLKFLTSTQRAFREQTERLISHRSALDVVLDSREKEKQEESLIAKHKEFAEKLEEVCDNLTLTENQLIGHQQQADKAECVTDLQQYQQEHQALQKDVLTNASALNEVISSTKRFLEENRSKLTPDQIAMIENKLEEAKSKATLINQRAEESRKDLEKVVTTAIKQESEKAAAVERLEESKNKIEGLLDWISNIGNENMSGLDQTDHISKENGNLPEETSAKGLIGKDDDANGNALQTPGKDFVRDNKEENTASLDLDKQYDRVKARHQEILSQQQDLIIATQSAQALLDKQANVLSPEEKQRLQKNIQDLKERYEASLTQAEQQMKQVQCVQEELKKFQGDCEEFESWLKQAEGEMDTLRAPAGSLNILTDKLQQQNVFSEDVISHKGDLRFITISGQKVLDVAKASGLSDHAANNPLLHVDTSGTCSAVKNKLDAAASRYKALHSQCNLLGNNLREVVDKYQRYDDSSTGLLKWLNISEEEARKQQSEAIATDPQILQKQLEETKALQGQMMGHQTAIDTLQKTAESLITTEGNLLSNPDEIQETVDDIAERYDNLSKSVSDRNEKLQITLTRSMSVQDGLDEMMGWMERVEASVKEKEQIPLDSASIGDMLNKEAALEQDILSRQSSISAIEAKMKKFVETADSSAAALLESKMDSLSERFADTCDKHKKKVSYLEQVKEKVEQFENISDKVQQFVMKRSQELQETDGPGKTFNEMSQLTQNTKSELAEYASDMEKLQTLSKELSEISPDGSKAKLQSKMDNVTNIFSTFKDTVKEKEEELSSCQDQLGEFRSAVCALTKWLEETNDRIPAAQPSNSEKNLKKDLQIVTGLLDEWTSKGPAVQDLTTKGYELCSLITSLTSPAKSKTPNKSALTNGGGPASHNYLTNKELMGIQQNMSFVNEGYASLGETLKSRKEQLSGLLHEVRETQKETEDMMTWLKDMKKTAESWNSASTEKDSVKTQLEQQKVVEDGIKGKQEQLQKLREKLTGLISAHPNSHETTTWKKMLSEIDAAWAEISGSVEERKQHLEQSNKNLDIFQSSELQLGQWLSEKELMMSVLGPLSIDPNMLKMQKQQVQILQNEFKSRKPQYEQLEEAAAAILNSSGNQEPSNGKLVNEKLTAVTQKWQGLMEQLDKRDSLIDQAVVKTGQFQELLRSLSNTATQLENQLTNHHTNSTQPDAVKKQLEDVQNISAQLREERKKLKQAEAINAELSALVTEDYLKADLARQLESVSKPFKQLEEKAAKRIEQLNSTFASSQQFHQTSKDFQSWLSEKLQEQSKSLPISAKVDVLQQTLKEQGKLQTALKDQEETYCTIIDEGEMLLQTIDGAEKLALQGQLTALSSNWEEVKKGSAEQADKLQAALLRSQKYHEHAEKLSSWIQDCEAGEGHVKLTVDPVAVEGYISQVKALQKDVNKHRGVVEQLNTAAESLLEVANTDTEGVTEDKDAIGKRLDKFVEGLQVKRECLEKISHTVKEFNDAHKEAKSQLEAAKKQVDSYESQSVQAHSNKNLTNMKAQHKSLEGVQNQVEHMKTLAKDLVVEVPDAEGVTELLLQADNVEKDYSDLNKKLEEACQSLESKLQGIGHFQNSIREMFTHFTELDDELDSMSPVDLDLATLKEQQDSIQSFVAKLQELMVNTTNAGDSCKKMLKDSESSPDLLGLKRDLDALSKQCGKLFDRSKQREVQVQSTLSKLEELYGKLHQVEDKLLKAVDKDTSQEVVGMETDVINQQLEAFKAFQKDDIEPLQTQLHDINLLGQSLIQNAAKGTSTKKLEDDLEGVNTKWNTLNKKIAERSAQLHEALLHCGRFQDALESLLSWLTDTEELVANQKPPSAEFKVVKAQIQEQKLLQRLLDDRKSTVELIKNEGGKVAELAESVDKEKVAKEIECLGQRWDTLLKKAENRHKQLESILVVTQQFHETLEPLSEWLAATEKHLLNSEPIGTETSKLEDQISQHKALEEEIMNRSKDLFQAVSLGQMLKTVSSVEDKEFVQSKLDTTQASYIELQERCRRKADMLQQALANAQLFGEDQVALMNWLNEVHSRLSDVPLEDYKTDVLEKQLAEQRTLQSDIESRKKNVDQAISNGMELLKQTTGDEVVIIQGKLDGIKTKYAEINSMGANVLKTLERVLSLSNELQDNHKDLSSWLEKAEAEIKMFADQEPAGEHLIHSQNRQKALLKETKEQKPVLDKLNELSSSLQDLIPWHTRENLDKLVTEDSERYQAVCDAITQRVDRINADILKSQQFEQAADTELSWLAEAERKLLSMGDIRLEQDQTTAQLQAQKIFSMDIMKHKDAVDEIVKTGKAIVSSKNPEEKEALKAKTQTLLEKYGIVSQLNSERCLQLERAQSLATQFWETYEEMWPWLQETLSTFSQLPQPAIEYETLKQQQEELRQMRELIAEHKPHIDKMNKTGPQLLELSPVEGAPIREKYTTSDQLYTKLKADVKQRAATLDEAISKSTQFHDKIDPMLESLGRIAERLRQPPSISVEVEKIKEQITENKAMSVDLEKLQPSYEMLKQRGEEMIARSEGADKDISAKAVQDKLDHMVCLWSDIQALLEEREVKLLDVMDLADKFWCDHCALIVTIKDSQDLLKELEEPGVDPSVVKQQQEFVEGFKEEIDGLQEELDVVQNQGAELMTACGEPDKPVIKKSLDEVNSAWENLNKTWKERVERLEEAMQAAVQFQDGLQGMFDWVDILESKLDSMSPVGTDLEMVKQQILELKEFKGETYQLQIEMERLNHQAGLLLKKVTEEADRCAIKEPMSELKMFWDNLDEKIISRQHKLEGGLLALGQFQHALDELLAWMSHTEELLNDQRKAAGDPKAIEIELAKHHVLQIDVLAHKSTIETVNKAGNELVESSAGEEASSLQSKLQNLNQRWKAILEKTEQRKQQLESSLLQAQGFHGEIEDMQQWLKDTERQLLASKAVGGLPDTAREQLNAHLELCSAFEAKEELYHELLNKGHQLLAMTPEGPDSNMEHDLTNLKEKWEAVQAKVTERKAKLEEALTLATDFHNSLQDFIVWLTQAEQTLNMVSPASLILETIMFQIDEHKIFVTEVNSHREHIIELDKTGTHLKYFSQKQDVVLIKNLLLSVQGRWEKLVQKSVERGRLLDDARKRAKQFHETFNKLMEWLDESESALDSEVEIANEPDKIKTQLVQHKEFQKALGSKHSVYDTTARTGRALKDKTALQDDKQKLDDMLSELRDKWDTVCGKSVERQNKLEEALLFSGQFTDALQALIDWLYKVEPQLAEDQPVHGDIDLVLNLIDNHKVFQKELGKKTVSVQALKRSARELIESSHDDSSWVKVQMQELSTRWETVCNLSVSKQTRLEQSLCQAEEFHSAVHILLEWLAEAEQSLRFHGSLPDDEEALRGLIEQQKEFIKKQEEKRVGLNKAISMGEAILSICHPDSITTIKHWNTIIKARFEEVQAWARQHQQRLATALTDLLATQDLLENLLTWLQWAETNLNGRDKEPMPQEIEEIKNLIAEHQAFMEEMTRKQPDVDKITKTHKRKPAVEPQIQSQIPVLDKGRAGRKRSPTQTMYSSTTQAPIETKNPRVNLLVTSWQHVWLLALDRRRKLNDALDRQEELKDFANFDFDVWRKRYMRWMNHKKSRVMDFFRRIDKDQDGKVTRQEFIEGILSSKFPTSRLEMSAVADIFDRDGDGYIDYYEFVAALHPNKDAYKPLTDADKIEDEVTRQVAKCKCPKRFQVEQIGANKYRFYLGNQFGLVHCLHDSLMGDETIANRENQNLTHHLHVAVLESCILFGDSQQLRLVRILRSTVMVRVGGGWMALDEFLVKNDPCRVHHHGSKMLRSESNSSITQSPIGWQISHFLTLLHEPTSAKGRTNMELREKFILPEGTTQVMASFRYRGRRSRPSSRGASPNRSISSQSCPIPTNPTATGTPKTPQHISRNYDKPWLTNSKSCTPLKSSDSFESQGSSSESTAVQGSKLRLPGYLSGKGFQSGEEATLINAAVLKARTQTIGESRKNSSRPGSKAGSRGSSRRGSDASDFDISDIQSVCSDASETVGESARATPRSVSRQHGGKPSKIPTPQRKTTSTSKLAKGSKR